MLFRSKALGTADYHSEVTRTLEGSQRLRREKRRRGLGRHELRPIKPSRVLWQRTRPSSAAEPTERELEGESLRGTRWRRRRGGATRAWQREGFTIANIDQVGLRLAEGRRRARSTSRATSEVLPRRLSRTMSRKRWEPVPGRETSR